MPTKTQHKSSLEPILRFPFQVFERICLIIFIVAVSHLIAVTGDLRSLIFFCFPLIFAMTAKWSPHSGRAAKLSAAIFLFLFGIGDVVVYFFHIPGRGIRGVSPYESQILGWYVIVYLAFVFVIWPPLLFIPPLLDRPRKRRHVFSTPICWFGLVVWGCFIAGFCAISIARIMHLL